MLTEIIHLPYAIKLHTVELYWSLLEAVMAEGGHTVVLDRIDGDPVGGWVIHLCCTDPATIGLIRDVADRKCHPDDPLSVL